MLGKTHNMSDQEIRAVLKQNNFDLSLAGRYLLQKALVGSAGTAPPAAPPASMTILQKYAACTDVKTLAITMLQDVVASGKGRKYLILKVIPACHPHKMRGASIGEKAVAERVSKIANKLKDYFTEHDLWDKTTEWTRHIDHLAHNGDL